MTTLPGPCPAAGLEAIPVALCSCSPVITPVAGADPVSASMGRITRMH
jgi:hypothetical protein